MLLRLAIVLLIVWLFGLTDVYDIGVFGHFAMLGGVLLLLLGGLIGRKSASPQNQPAADQDST